MKSMNIVGWVVAAIVIVGGAFYVLHDRNASMPESSMNQATSSSESTSDTNSINVDVTAGATTSANTQ